MLYNVPRLHTRCIALFPYKQMHSTTVFSRWSITKEVIAKVYGAVIILFHATMIMMK